MRPTRAFAAAALVISRSILFALAILVSGCSEKGKAAPEKSTVNETPAPTAEVQFHASSNPRKFLTATSVRAGVSWFSDVSAACGIVHVYKNGAGPKALMVESTGGGCGLIDYDRDGNLDLFTQGGRPMLRMIPNVPPMHFIARLRILTLSRLSQAWQWSTI